MSPFQFGDAPKFEGEGKAIAIPAALGSKADLLEFLFRAIPLPEYFGQNWDALDECLEELDWNGSGQIALVHADIPPEKSPEDQRTYLEILADVAENSSRLVVVFCEQDRARIEALLKTD